MLRKEWPLCTDLKYPVTRDSIAPNLKEKQMNKDKLDKLRSTMINATPDYTYPEGTNSSVIIELIDHIDILQKFLAESRRQSNVYYNKLQEKSEGKE